MTSGLPFDDFRALAASLPAARSDASTRRAFAAAAPLHGEAGKIGDLAVWASCWNANAPALFVRPLVAVFAGTNALSGGADATPNRQTKALVEASAAGTAAVNALCAQRELALKVFDLALEYPSGDISVQAALDERGCAATMAFGMEAVSGGTDILGVGSFGRGNEACSSALLSACAGVDIPDTAPEAAQAKQALRLHAAHLGDPLEALRRLGSREIAAMTGAILAARMESIPVILDGHAALAAASVLSALNPQALDHCRYAGADLEASRALGFATLTDIAAGFDGGAGAAIALGMVRDAVKLAAMISPGVQTASV